MNNQCITIRSILFIGLLGLIFHTEHLQAQTLQYIGGEMNNAWRQGTNQKIQWDTSKIHGTVTLSLWNRESGTFSVLTTTASASAGEYSWDIPDDQATGDGFRMKIEENSTHTYELSGAFFTIHPDESSLDKAHAVERPSPDEDSFMNLYPNPANETAYLQWSKAHAAFIHIVDMKGVSVGTYNMRGQSSVQIKTLPLPVGIYMINIQYEDGTRTGEIMQVYR